MIKESLTPKSKSVPGAYAWGSSAPNMIPAEQSVANVIAMRELEAHYGSRMRVNPDNIYATNFTDDTLSAIMRGSEPVRSLGATVSKTYLSLYEATSALRPEIHERLEGSKMQNLGGKLVEKINPRGRFRSFHMHDNDGESIELARQVVTRHPHIVWEWVAVAGPDPTREQLTNMLKTPEKWLTSSGEIASADLRAWRNHICVRMKELELVISMSADTIAAIIFALDTLATGGHAVIRVDRLSTPAVVGATYLFAQCFARSEIVHTLVGDRMFIVGSGFNNGTKKKHICLLHSWLDTDPGHTGAASFAGAHMDSPDVGETVSAISRLNTAVFDWRYEHYDAIFDLNSRLSRSASRSIFEDFLENQVAERFPDQTAEWVAATGWGR